MRTPHLKFAVVVCLTLALASIPDAARAAEPVRLDSWQLLTDPAAGFTATTLPADGWRPAVAGRSWNAQFDDLRDYFGVAWYKTTFEMPKGRAPHVLLRFGAVDYAAEIYVNGHRAGAHEGAYTPFSVDVADLEQDGVEVDGFAVDGDAEQEPFGVGDGADLGEQVIEEDVVGGDGDGVGQRGIEGAVLL